MASANGDLQSLAAAAAAAAQADAAAHLPPLDDAGHLASDQLCLRCGYNLRGLAPAGRCPECGLPASHTLTHGLTRTSDYARLLHKGCTLARFALGLGALAWTLLLPLGLTGAAASDAAGAMAVPAVVLILLQLVLGGIAQFWLAAPAASEAPSAAATWPRLLARQAPVVAAASFGLSVFGCVVESRPMVQALLSLCLISIGVGLFALWQHLGQLASRLALPGSARAARLLSWASAGFMALLLLLWLALLTTTWDALGLSLVGDELAHWFWWIVPAAAFLSWPILALWSAILLTKLRRRLQ